MRLGISLALTQPRAGTTFDPAAAAFFAAAAITDATQKSAVNRLVLDLKAASLWTPMQALYPFVGGAATPHSFNLKNPAAFQITWHGTVTHNANGITGNAIDGYGDTGLVENTLTQTSLAFGVYNRTVDQDGTADIGAGTNVIQMLSEFSDGNGYFDNPNASRISVAVADPRGLMTCSRTATNAVAAYRNGNSIVTGTDPEGAGTASTFKILTAGAAAFSARNLALAFIASGLTSGNIAALYTAVQAYQTTLGRQV